MATTIDKVKVDAMMTMISMSLMWAMPTNIPVDVDSSKNKGHLGTNAAIERVVDNKKEVKPAAIKTFGKIKKSSVNKVNSMLDSYLTKKGSVDTVVITVGNSVEKFGQERLGVDFRQMQEGEKIKGMHGIQIFIAEDEIDTLLPSVLMTLNEYQKTH